MSEAPNRQACSSQILNLSKSAKITTNTVQHPIQTQVGQVEAEFDVIDTSHINRQEMSKVELCTLEFCESMLHFGGEIKDCSLERDIP